MKNKATLWNMISGLLLQFCTLISGFILPKIVLSYFGSDVNGLISSLNQFLSYITLIEGGVSSVIIANLYKPLVNRNDEKLSSVIVTADKFYKKVGLLFVGYSLLIAFVYPLIFSLEYSFLYVFMLTIILSINLLIQYMFSLTLKSLLKADKKMYIVNFTQAIIIVSNIFLAIISVNIYPSIHILKLISGSLFILQPIVFGKYIKRHYCIDWDANIDNSLIKERWSGFAINLAAFIHNSTDITILTFFTDLKTVSIYSVYALVSGGLKQVIYACISGISPSIGQAYAKKDFEELNRKMDIFEYIVFVLVSILFTVAALLITPFVNLYTKGVQDANYYQPVFGILLLVSEALYLIKIPHMSLAYAANKFKELTVPSFMEAGLNIVVSIILVSKLSLLGVAIGTIIGMLYRTIYHVHFTKTIVSDRSPSIFYKKLTIFFIVIISGYTVCNTFIPMNNVTILNWLLYGIIYCAIVGGMCLIISFIFFRDELKFFLKYLKW